jgi:hypothetical protein
VKVAFITSLFNIQHSQRKRFNKNAEFRCICCPPTLPDDLRLSDTWLRVQDEYFLFYVFNKCARCSTSHVLCSVVILYCQGKYSVGVTVGPFQASEHP